MWSEQAVVYQVYLRSFQDSDGDGVGDLPGLRRRLEHVAGLGVDAVWLSPVFPSPNADYGYDVSDYTAVDPAFGTLADLDAVIARAHELELEVLLDFVPCHTSIEHPWFRERPEYYFWAEEPPNNWRAAFGGSAWERDGRTGRYYLSSFYPEQADLNWRNPEVRGAIGEALRFWIDRGIDGFRLDALDRLLKDAELRDDPPATGRPALPMDAADAALDHRYSRNAPDIGLALGAIRDAVGSAFLVGEVYLPADELPPYQEWLDVCFSFEALHAGSDTAKLKAAIAAAIGSSGVEGWVLSNHDFSRLASRSGPDNARAATLLLLSLPGPVFMFQGDELGMANSEPSGPPLDRSGRDAYRIPMRWQDGPQAGFTNGTPWLQTDVPQPPSVAAQAGDPDSHLSLVRRAIALRPRLSGPCGVPDSPPETVLVTRGEFLIAVNYGAAPAELPGGEDRELELEARPGDGADLGMIPAHGAWIARRS